MLRNPLHANMTIVVGALSIFLIGWFLEKIQKPALAEATVSKGSD
jgi:hypothetical protein